MEEDLRSYGLALLDEEDVSPPRVAPDLALARPLTTEVASSGLSAESVPLAVIPNSSTSVPFQVSSKAAP